MSISALIRLFHAGNFIQADTRSLPRRLVLGAVLLTGLRVGGAVGSIGIEGWNIEDALYMTIITLRTAGYSELGVFRARAACSRCC